MGTVDFLKRDQNFKTDFCEPNLNLLAHAQALEIEVGSRCGGHGICGGDVVRINPAPGIQLSPITEAENRHLGAQQIAAGYRLACQCYPESSDLNLVVEVGVQIASKVTSS